MFSNNLPVCLDLLQSVHTCCWPTMHQWRWRTLRDGAPWQRPSATGTGRWVSICPCLVKPPPPPPRLTHCNKRGSGAASVGMSCVRTLGEWERKGPVDRCKLTNSSAHPGSQWGRDAARLLCPSEERGHSSRALWLLCLDERQFIRCSSLFLLIGWLSSSPSLAHFLPHSPKSGSNCGSGY